MEYYELGYTDQSKSSWVLFSLREGLSTPAPDRQLPAPAYQFLGPAPDGPMEIKPDYEAIRCSVCHRYLDDDVFEVGFSEPVQIRIRGDFSYTDDRVLVVRDVFLSVLHEIGARGFESKPIGTSGWHALRITERVDYSDDVMELVGSPCPGCGRHERTRGSFRYRSQLSLPATPFTLFTTTSGWPSMLWDRDVFMTEDVVQALKSARVSGGYCNRLLDAAEEQQARAALPKFWMPPKSTISLSGR